MPQAAIRKKKRKDGKPFNPGSPKKLARLLKQKDVLDLRLEGYSYDEIGRRHGMTASAAYQMIMGMIDRYQNEFKEKLPQARDQEIERCRKLLTYCWPAAEKGDPKAIATALKISERIARLKGLDAPVDVRHSGTGEGGAITVEVFRKMLEDEAAPDAAPTLEQVTQKVSEALG